jgi:hypothetical protein
MSCFDREICIVMSFQPSHSAKGATHHGREVLACAMRSGAATLQRLAERLAPRAAPVPMATLPRLEYHCEAGAPEGALYVDGVLFGHVQGVHRL